MGKRKVERRERETNGLSAPGALDEICQLIFEGGTLASIAKNFDIRYWALHIWVNSDPERARRVKEAEKARIEYLTDQRLEVLKIVAFGDIRALYTPEGRLRPVPELDAALAQMIQGFDITEGALGFVTKKLKFWDKLNALEAMGKLLRPEDGEADDPTSFDQGEVDTMRRSLADKLARLGAPEPSGAAGPSGRGSRPPPDSKPARQVRQPVEDAPPLLQPPRFKK